MIMQIDPDIARNTRLWIKTRYSPANQTCTYKLDSSTTTEPFNWIIMNNIKTGLDILRDGYWKNLRGFRIGLLANQASLDSRLTPAKEIIISRLPGQLTALFGPQHGFGGEDQDNMIETGHGHDEDMNIPIFSLYSSTRQPQNNMLDMIDLLVIDLQDVGTRVYTFASTMLNCMKSAARKKKKVIVLDRPNPLGGEIVEGNILKAGFFSFVGPYHLPMRHGLTMGEMAVLFNRVFNLRCDLEIVKMQGWQRRMLWHDTGLRWVMPSPNMPVPETAYVYPGQVIWEGTNISEGRGTCRPFEIFGAPYIDSRAVLEKLDPDATTGCHIRKYTFRPTFNKWKNQLCHGLMIHILDPVTYRPFYTSMAILKVIMELYPDSFEWKSPPYEYEYKKMPIDIIMGDSSVRLHLEAGSGLTGLRERWLPELEEFRKWKYKYHLY